jgi:hypothetical protein
MRATVTQKKDPDFFNQMFPVLIHLSAGDTERVNRLTEALGKLGSRSFISDFSQSNDSVFEGKGVVANDNIFKLLNEPNFHPYFTITKDTETTVDGTDKIAIDIHIRPVSLALYHVCLSELAAIQFTKAPSEDQSDNLARSQLLSRKGIDDFFIYTPLPFIKINTTADQLIISRGYKAIIGGSNPVFKLNPDQPYLFLTFDANTAEKPTDNPDDLGFYNIPFDLSQTQFPDTLDKLHRQLEKENQIFLKTVQEKINTINDFVPSQGTASKRVRLGASKPQAATQAATQAAPTPPRNRQMNLACRCAIM